MTKRKSQGAKPPSAPKRQRKSKAESMTGAKEAEVEVRGGPLGLPEPVEIASDDFALHMKAIKAATERKDTAVGVLRTCLKQANRFNPHLGKAIQDAIKFERDGDPVKLRQKLEVMGIALREIGCSVQISIFDTLLGDVKEQAFKRGEADGKAGKPADNRYPEGSDLAQAYTKGWQTGNFSHLGLSPEDIDKVLHSAEGEAAPSETQGAVVTEFRRVPPPDTADQGPQQAA